MPLDITSVLGAVGSWVGSILAVILEMCVLNPMTVRFAGRGRSSSLPPLDNLSPQNDVVELLKENNRLLRKSIWASRETNVLLEGHDSSDALLRQSISASSEALALLRRQIRQNQRLMRQILSESREANIRLRRQVVLHQQAHESLVDHFLRTQDILHQAIVDRGGDGDDHPAGGSPSWADFFP